MANLLGKDRFTGYLPNRPGKHEPIVAVFDNGEHRIKWIANNLDLLHILLKYLDNRSPILKLGGWSGRQRQQDDPHSIVC